MNCVTIINNTFEGKKKSIKPFFNIKKIKNSIDLELIFLRFFDCNKNKSFTLIIA